MATLVVSGVKFAGHSRSGGTLWKNNALEYPSGMRANHSSSDFLFGGLNNKALTPDSGLYNSVGACYTSVTAMLSAKSIGRHHYCQWRTRV